MRTYRTPRAMQVDLSPLKRDLSDLITGHHRGWFSRSAWFQSHEYNVYARAGTIRHPTKMGEMIHALTLANFAVRVHGKGVGTAIVKVFQEVAREHDRVLFVENASEVTARICNRLGLKIYRQDGESIMPCYYLD